MVGKRRGCFFFFSVTPLGSPFPRWDGREGRHGRGCAGGVAGRCPTHDKGVGRRGVEGGRNGTREGEMGWVWPAVTQTPAVNYYQYINFLGLYS